MSAKERLNAIFTPERRKVLARTARFARQGILFVSAAAGIGAVGAGVYDAIVHAQGEKGLTQGFVWGVVPWGDCAAAGFIASHSVSPNEQVSLTVNGQEFDLSGRSLGLEGDVFCFEDADQVVTRITFQATNGGVRGKEEIYEPGP